jgi:TetR/AcrR family transcriptional regulator, ethionamide resistance regulator
MQAKTTIRRRSRRPAITRGDERELALLSCAESLLAEGRFESASLQEIAARAGISRPTFYFYFNSRQALLVGLVERTLDELTEKIGRAIRPADEEPALAMRAVMRGVADLWWQHHAALMAAAELAGSTPSVFERMRSVIELPMSDMARLLRRVGGSSLTRDQSSAERLSLRLAWMTERNFYVLGRSRPSRKQLYALADELAEICLATAGHRG